MVPIIDEPKLINLYCGKTMVVMHESCTKCMQIKVILCFLSLSCIFLSIFCIFKNTPEVDRICQEINVCK